MIGDILQQRVLLQHAGRDLQLAAMPPADRVGLWLERRTPQTQTDADGRRWLLLSYQLINAPRVPTTATLPPLVLLGTSGTGDIRLSVPAWPFSLGPLTPADGGWPALQPDRPVQALPTQAIERQLWAAAAVLAAVLLSWLGWWGWRQWREAQHLPFARAWDVLRRLDATDPAGWLALHQAINQSAGRVVHVASLGRWLDEAPQWRELRDSLAGFFAASNARFFGAADVSGSFPLRQLGRALRDAERRHQR